MNAAADLPALSASLSSAYQSMPRVRWADDEIGDTTIQGTLLAVYDGGPRDGALAVVLWDDANRGLPMNGVKLAWIVVI